jgi:hypothetical protein
MLAGLCELMDMCATRPWASEKAMGITRDDDKLEEKRAEKEKIDSKLSTSKAAKSKGSDEDEECSNEDKECSNSGCKRCNSEKHAKQEHTKRGDCNDAVVKKKAVSAKDDKK